jgi:hypothetical protein
LARQFCKVCAYMIILLTPFVLLLCVAVPPLVYKNRFGGLRTSLAAVFGVISGLVLSFVLTQSFLKDTRSFYSGDVGQLAMIFAGIPLLLAAAVAWGLILIRGIARYNEVVGVAPGEPDKKLSSPGSGFYGAAGILLLPAPLVRLFDSLWVKFGDAAFEWAPVPFPVIALVAAYFTGALGYKLASRK